MKNNPQRYLEIDLLRTLAITMMVAYHLAFDLEYYYDIPILRTVGTGGWIFARSTAILFLLLAGMSISISKKNGTARKWKRIGIILLCALGISAITYMWEPETYVRFGILHCIAGSLALLMIVPPSPVFRGVLALGIMLLGNMEIPYAAETELLVPFGIRPSHFVSLDYFPLLPWSGVVLAGSALTPYTIRRMHTYSCGKHSVVSWMTLPGRHALFLYMVHQPILILILSIVLS